MKQRQKRKNLLFTVSVLLLTVMLAACGTGGTAEEPGANEGAKETENEGGTETESGTNPSTGGPVKIGIMQFVEHPSLDATRDGIIEALAESGFIEGENAEIEVRSAQGDPTNNTTIAQDFVGDQKDVIIAIATPSAQAAAQATAGTGIPVVFTAVTDPADVNIEDVQHPGGHVTGVSDTFPGEPNAIAKLAEFVSQNFPDVKTVGMVYNAGEANSVTSLENARDAFGKYDIDIIEATAANTSDVKQAAESLIGQADAILVDRDNTAVSALSSIVQVANDNDLPFFAGDFDTVEGGALAAYGFRYFDLGTITGNMVADILNGANPGEIPISYPEKLELAINTEAAEAQGVELSEEVLSQAYVTFPE